VEFQLINDMWLLLIQLIQNGNGEGLGDFALLCVFCNGFDKNRLFSDWFETYRLFPRWNTCYYPGKMAYLLDLLSRTLLQSNICTLTKVARALMSELQMYSREAVAGVHHIAIRGSATKDRTAILLPTDLQSSDILGAVNKPECI